MFEVQRSRNVQPIQVRGPATVTSVEDEVGNEPREIFVSLTLILLLLANGDLLVW